MPAVLEQKADKFSSQVDEQLAQATSRIRFHDVAFGGLVLVAMLLVYAVGMIVLDKYVVLPEWVRQLSLVALIGALAAAAWFTIGSAFTRRVNPLYAAVQVEKTIDDAKNSVVGYVEAQENGQVHPAVKTAMGARAAKSVAQADVNHAVDHRGLMYAGVIAVAFLLALIVLFFVFRPSQFKSLAARTFAPFSSDPIANRTQLTLVEPAGGDVTITTGQSITVKVAVAGQVPSASNPERLRVLVRHNLATPDFEEVPMEKGEHSREWLVRVPDHLVRNGFWYKVAGGDAETAEYRVTVRTLPLFTDYDVTYEFPAYTRMKPETSHDAHLRAIRGTKVVIVGKTNRTVKDGRLVFDPVTREPVLGKVPPDKLDSVQFAFALTASGHYRMTFTSTDSERSPEPPPFKIVVDEDLAPHVDILKPDEPEIALPANGQLAVDGFASDDFGLESMTLKLRIVEPAPRDLADQKFQDGKSFRRAEKDGTFSWPASLDYKGSVDFTKLTDAGGQPAMLKEGMVLEYWLEAADNRTKPGASGPEPDPNVGKSSVKKVRLAAPIVAMDEKKNLDAQKDQRKNEEKAHAAAQQKKLDTEKRDQPPPAGMPPEATPMMPPPMTGDPMPMPKGMNDPMPPMKGMNDPMPKGMNDPMMPPMNMGMPEMAPAPGTPGQRNDDNTAEKIQKELEKQQKSGGAAKPGPEEKEPANPAEPKPTPMAGGMPPPDSGSKEPPKDPMTGGAESKPMGEPKQPQEPGSAKPEPSPMDMTGGGAPADSKPAPKNMDPMTGGAGADKPQPKDANPMPMEGAKPSGEQSNSAQGAGQSKPMPGSEPGAEKPEPKPMDGNSPMDPKSKPQDGGDAKPRSGPPPSDAKPGPMDMKDPMGSGTSEPKPMPNDMRMGGGETKPDMSKPNAGGAAPDKGVEKPSPDQKPGDGAKPTPEQQKEFEQNLKDLANGDPKKQQAARDNLDKSVGEKNRKDIEQGMKDFEKNVKDLNSKDDKTKQEARKNLDKQVGEKTRKDIEDIQKGLNSNDPKEQDAAKEKLKDLQQKAGADKADQQPKEGGAGEKKIDPKEVEKAMNDLQSPEKDKRDAAKDKLDKSFGKGAGDKAEQLQNDLKSDDMAKRDAAKKEIERMQKKAEEMAKKGGSGAGETKIDPKEVEKAMNDLQSPDKETRDAAKEKLDKSFGKGAGDKAEQLQNDLKSDDMAKRDAAKKELEGMQKKADEMAKKDGAGGGKKVDPREVEKALDDVAGDDPAKKAEAKKKLDDMLGKGAGDKAEQAAEKMKSEDFNKQAEARKERDDLLNQAEKMAKGENPKPKEPSKEDLDRLEKNLKDLGSKDDAKRQQAEKELDKQIGEQARKEIQDAMKDPKKAEELKGKIEKFRQGGGNLAEPVREAMKEDARNRAKSAQLQLEQFEKNKDNKDLQRELNMTPEEYQAFIERFRKNAENLKKQADELENTDPTKPLPPSVNVSGGNKIDSKGGASGAGTAGGPTVPAPGYGEALREFNKTPKPSPKK